MVGTANAIMREGLWGLGLFAVAPEHQGRGVGRRLLDAALAYGDGARGGWIMSSEDPGAMRRYALAGFDLRPCVAAAGRLRADLPAVEVDESSDLRATEPKVVAQHRHIPRASEGNRDSAAAGLAQKPDFEM